MQKTKSISIALVWVFLLTLAAFPELFSETKAFLERLCSFENIGKPILITVVIYMFDILTTEVLFINEPAVVHAHAKWSAIFPMAVLLVLYFTISQESTPLYPILLVCIVMGTWKTICIHQLFQKQEREKAETFIRVS